MDSPLSDDTEILGYGSCAICDRLVEETALRLLGSICGPCAAANMATAISVLGVDDVDGRWRKTIPWWVDRFIPELRRRTGQTTTTQVRRDAHALLARVHPGDYLACKGIIRASIGEPPWTSRDLRSPHLTGAIETLKAVAAYSVAHGKRSAQGQAGGREQ